VEGMVAEGAGVAACAFAWGESVFCAEAPAEPAARGVAEERGFVALTGAVAGVLAVAEGVVVREMV